MTVYHLHSFDRFYRSMHMYLFKLLYRGFVPLSIFLVLLDSGVVPRSQNLILGLDTTS